MSAASTDNSAPESMVPDWLIASFGRTLEKSLAAIAETLFIGVEQDPRKALDYLLSWAIENDALTFDDIDRIERASPPSTSGAGDE